jgi:hypothetical protein
MDREEVSEMSDKQKEATLWSYAECERLAPMIVDTVDLVSKTAGKIFPKKAGAGDVALVMLLRAIQHALKDRGYRVRE